MNRHRVIAALHSTPNGPELIDAIEALIREAVDEALETAAVEIEREEANGRTDPSLHPVRSRTARIVRSHKETP